MSVQHVNIKKPYLIGLTGGIGSGKSTAADYFVSKGIFVIDCDRIVANLWKKDHDMQKEIENAFGFKVKSDEDKKKLTQLIFSDSSKRQLINDIIHPRVFDSIERLIVQHQEESIIVIDMPLLFEVNYQKHCDVTVLVYAETETQIKRLIERNDYKKEDALIRIQAQMPLIQKREMAHIILDNSNTKEELYKQIDQILRGI
ncbi:MAG: dephospho-CoA kinase [Acholeplasmataceae bacterium]|nr:dephospho-CoA kinase [Acholeplasmataceae bacterium]